MHRDGQSYGPRQGKRNVDGIGAAAAAAFVIPPTHNIHNDGALTLYLVRSRKPYSGCVFRNRQNGTAAPIRRCSRGQHVERCASLSHCS